MGILPRAFVFVLTRPAALVNLLALFVASTYARAPHAGLVSPRESDSTEDGAAVVANLSRENSVLREEFVTLLSGEHHRRTFIARLGKGEER